MGELTTIPIFKATRERVKVLGHKGESYDLILNRILDEVDYLEMMERQYERLKEKDRFVSLDEIE
jgi:hypothetical protein